MCLFGPLGIAGARFGSANTMGSWSIDQEPIVDPGRRPPENVSAEFHDAFMKLPTEALPQRPGVGKANYTLVMDGNAKIEVQLRERKFTVKCYGDCHKGKKVKNPACGWSVAGIEAAWKLAKERLQPDAE